MKEKINHELIKLQQELSKIQSAASQLSKAEKASSDVINAVNELQAKYDKSLNKILTLTEEYLKKNNNDTQKSLENILNPHKAELEAASKAILELEKTIKKSEQKSSDALNKLAVGHKQQIDSVNKILRNYLDLAASTAKLSDKIDTVDFPEYLTRISTNISEIGGEITTLRTNLSLVNPVIETLEKRIKRNNKKINFAMTVGILAFIVLLFVAYQTVLIRYFPEAHVLKEFLPE